MTDDYIIPKPIVPQQQLEKKDSMAYLFEGIKSTDHDVETKDLFIPPQPQDNDIYTEDLTSLDIEQDVMGGDMSDLFEVPTGTFTIEQQKVNNRKLKPRVNKIKPADYESYFRGLS